MERTCPRGRVVKMRFSTRRMLILSLAIHLLLARPSLAHMTSGLPSVSGDCPDGFTGPDCQPCEENTYTGECAVACDLGTCSYHGRCEGNTGQCLCFPGWTGEHCETREAPVCPEGFTGPDCQPCEEDVYSEGCLRSCDMAMCSYHGRCEGNTGQCLCFPGWTGGTHPRMKKKSVS